MTSTETATTLFSRLAVSFTQRKDELDDLGALAGNPGYGVAMADAFAEAAEAVSASAETGFGAVLVTGSRSLKTEAEPLLGLVFLELGRACQRNTSLDLNALKEGLRNTVTSLVRIGGARFGDGTLLDALLPLSEAVHAAKDLNTALDSATQTAKINAVRPESRAYPSGLAVVIIIETLADIFSA